jgi:two-component system NtrC family sensor kinase
MARVSKTSGKAGKKKPRKAKARKPTPAKGHKAAKRRIAPAAPPRKRRSVRDLTKELNEAREQQAASAEILAVINSSKGDLTPVFDIVLEKAHSLCDVTSGSLQLLDGDQIRAVAVRGMTGSFEKILRQGFHVSDRLRQSINPDRPVHTPDLVQLLATAPNEPVFRAAVELENIRTTLSVALAKDGVPLGRIVAARKEVRPFTEKQIALLQGFANQAVIAIENARLFNETREALEQQKASADILRVISNSVADPAPVFDKILDACGQLFNGVDMMVFLVENDQTLTLGAIRGPDADRVERVRRFHPRPVTGTVTELAIRERRLVTFGDVFKDPGVPEGLRRVSAEVGETYSVATAPMLWKDRGIGAIVVSRFTPLRPFDAAEQRLLQTFADQAVIAIQNANLFNEAQARTRELSESLQQQTATADVLKVISRSTFDLQTVLETLIRSAVDLSGANRGSIFLREGDVFPLKAASHTTPEFLQYWAANPPRAGRGSATHRVIGSGKIEIIPDVLEDPEMEMPPGALARIRATLGVPMLRDNKVEGVLVLTRPEPGQFSQSQIDLVQTFADQAVIAVENVRLFDETQARTRDLTEALTYQTGSSNILRVIASSPTDVGPVLDAIIESARELCEAHDAVVMLKDGDELHFRAQQHGPIPINLDKWPINRKSVTGRSVVDRVPVQVRDMLSDEGEEFPIGQEMSRHQGHRTILSVPLLREDEVIGTIALRRTEVNPFSQKQIALLQTFADQAVIAIGNVRLFDEVQERTQELSQSLEELRTAQDRLVQTEKLASLGQLTAGIAHEIKNPLNFVNNFSSLSAELIDELDEALAPAALDQKTRDEVSELTAMLKSNLGKVVQHGKRADSIVKNMLLHSREGSGEHRAADINALVEESLNLAYHGARAEKSAFNITLTRDLDPEAGSAELYPQEITRALLNFITNGFYAATRRKAEAADEDFEPALRATTKNLGKAVEIRIRDNGTGIPPEVKEKMFNPFFTTKPAGEGTGLGLSMSHDIIVKQHGGRIDVETEPGLFTEFIITLPRHTAALPA